MESPHAESKHSLAKNVGTKTVLLLGIGALLGGGIFTLLGPAIAYAGSAVLIALFLGAIISFLNLQTYASLASTLPEAGGGNRWVKFGLGDFQGFMAGWISWLAHAAACGLYALSGGFYIYHLLFSIFGIPNTFNIGIGFFEKIIAIILIFVFGWINWRSNKSSQQLGGIIVIILLVILGLFIGSGVFHISATDAAFNWKTNFTDFANFNLEWLIGIFAAAALFYIAFEGSEIQSQSGEEVKNPKSLKTALFGAWGIVSIFYLLVAFVMIANGPLRDIGEGAIINSASSFMPLGVILMTIGGIFANIAALNATIFSSSRLTFSLARDKSILNSLAHIHSKNLTPDWATLSSVILIAAMVIALPLLSVAASASLLFIILFLQLNIANIAIRRENPEIKWNYKIIGYPYTTVAAVILYIILAIAMAFIISAAWFVTIFWVLFGIINYFAYTRLERHESFEKEVLYEKTLRLGTKKAYRLLFPIDEDASFEEINKLAEFAFVLASYYRAEIIAVTIASRENENIAHQRQMMDKITDFAKSHNDAKKEQNVDIHTYVLFHPDVVETILQIIREEDCDILVMSWNGYVQSKGKIFGSKIDPVLRKAECDLVIYKTNGIINPRSILFATDFRFKSPFLRFGGKVASAFSKAFKSKVTIFTVIQPEFKNTSEYAQWREHIDFKIKSKIKFDADVPYEIKISEEKSVGSAILKESEHYDIVVLGAAREKLFSEIRAGNIPEFVAKHIKKPAIIIKGHRGIAQPLIDYVKDRLGV